MTVPVICRAEEKRENLCEELARAWKDYEDTGLHAAGDEVAAWIASWGTENELPVPECRV